MPGSEDGRWEARWNWEPADEKRAELDQLTQKVIAARDASWFGRRQRTTTGS